MKAPRVLRAYIVFAILASVLAFVPIFSRQLHEAFIPYTNSSGGFFVYAMTLSFPILAAQGSLRQMVFAVLGLLLITIVGGLFDTAWRVIGSPDTYGDSYLRYSKYRPFVTVFLPAIWLILLVTPHMRKWIRSSGALLTS